MQERRNKTNHPKPTTMIFPDWKASSLVDSLPLQIYRHNAVRKDMFWVLKPVQDRRRRSSPPCHRRCSRHLRMACGHRRPPLDPPNYQYTYLVLAHIPPWNVPFLHLQLRETSLVIYPETPFGPTTSYYSSDCTMEASPEHLWASSQEPWLFRDPYQDIPQDTLEFVCQMLEFCRNQWARRGCRSEGPPLPTIQSGTFDYSVHLHLRNCIWPHL